MALSNHITRNGLLEDVVRASVENGVVGERDHGNYARRLTLPTEANLATITQQYTPQSVNLTGLQPDLETRQRAEAQDQQKSDRRLRQRLGL